MVLRAGVILPFQFGDVKKLLMVGSPEEDRDLKLFDFTNVVRAAFNIYNFEFRNKKIDFHIPEELLIHYLQQCKDLTNFVIQIDQAGNHATTIIETTGSDHISIEPSCSQSKAIAYLQKSESSDTSPLMRNNFVNCSNTLQRGSADLSSPLDVTSHSDHSMSNNPEPINKVRRTHFYANRTPESLTQSLDPTDIMPKSEHEEAEMNAHKLRQRQQQQQQQQHQQQPQQQQQHQINLPQQPPHFFPTYGHTLLTSTPTLTTLQPQPQHPQHIQHVTNRFRIFESRHIVPHCATCHCVSRYDIFKPGSCYDATRSNLNICKASLSQRYPDSDVVPSYRSNGPFKIQNQIESPLSDDEDEPPAKLRVSTKLLERQPPCNGTSVRNATSTAPSTSTSPGNKSNSTNPNEDDADNESQPSSPERDFNKHEDVAQQPYILTPNDFFLQQQLQQQRLQQHPLHAQHHSYEEQQYQQTQYTNTSGYLQDSEHNNSRQRKERMSKRQKELYVEFLERNPIVSNHRRNDPVLDSFWLQLANILNECPNGAAKSVAEWKQAFDNWRYRVFLYARHNSQLLGDDALNSKIAKPLTRTDKRAYNLWIRNPDTAPANVEKLPNDFVCSED